MMRSLTAAVAAMGLAASPVLAQANLPARSDAVAATPASERIEGQQAMGNATWWIIGGLLLGALVLILVLGGDDDDVPASP